MKNVVLVSRLLLAVVLLFAGAVKGLSTAEAVKSVGAFHMTPHWFSIALGIALPGVEAVTGAALLLGHWLRGASLLAAGMSTMFAIAVTSAMWRQLDIECGCFGALPVAPRANFTTLSIDATMFVLAMIVFFGSARRDRS